MREATEQERQGVNEYIRSISQRVYSKNEVIAMLEELKEEITALPMYYDPLDIGDLIQQKIDKLRSDVDA